MDDGVGPGMSKDPELAAAMELYYGPPPTNPGEGFLHHLKANPTLLAPAPEDRSVWSAAMDHRAYDEKHPCLRCGADAQNAIIAETPDRPRFLDLCHDCKLWLMKQMDEADMRPW